MQDVPEKELFRLTKAGSPADLKAGQTHPIRYFGKLMQVSGVPIATSIAESTRIHLQSGTARPEKKKDNHHVYSKSYQQNF